MKSIKIIPFLLLFLFCLSGCSIPSGDELLAAPKPSKNYQTLQVELEKILALQNYTAPLSGDNRSTIQLIDLDNDGTEESVSFFRSKDSNLTELTICIHKRYDDNYVLAGYITGSGTGIESVDFPVITPDGKRGMVVSWQLAGDGLSALSVCDFDENCAPNTLLETEYSSMELTDLTGDGAKDLLVLTTDDAGKRVARLYQYSENSLFPVGEALPSQDAVTVERIFNGRIADNAAILTESRTASGVGLVTDIFVFSDGVLQNIALDSEDFPSRGTYRPLSVNSTDINKDGIIEFPRAVLMAGYTDAASPDSIFMLDWYSYSINEMPELIETTYQNISEEWFFRIDSSWHDRITATKTTENGLSAVHFAEYINETYQTPLFSIYCATGPMREFYEGRTDLIPLSKTNKALFFARISPEAAESSIAISENDIRSRFEMVAKTWNS